MNKKIQTASFYKWKHFVQTGACQSRASSRESPVHCPASYSCWVLASDTGSPAATDAWQAKLNSPHMRITTSSHRGITAGRLLFSTGRICESGNMKKSVLKKSTKRCTNAGTTVWGETLYDVKHLIFQMFSQNLKRLLSQHYTLLCVSYFSQ